MSFSLSAYISSGIMFFSNNTIILIGNVTPKTRKKNLKLKMENGKLKPALQSFCFQNN